MVEQLTELGFYGLAGHSASPRDLLAEIARGEELGLGSVFLSDAATERSVAAVRRGAERVTSVPGAIDAVATTDQLRQIADLLPDEWLASAATGSPEQCAATVAAQFDLGVDSVILHGATPDELAPVVTAYRAARPAGHDDLPANPGRMP